MAQGFTRRRRNEAAQAFDPGVGRDDEAPKRGLVLPLNPRAVHQGGYPSGNFSEGPVSGEHVV
jgi:hypothetical protein